MSLFSARHYVWLTAFARQAKLEAQERSDPEEAIDQLIRRLANTLARESEGFDRKRFLHDVLGDPL